MNIILIYLLILIDFEQAFDLVNVSKFIEILVELKVSIKLIKLIQVTLRDSGASV